MSIIDNIIARLGRLKANWRQPVSLAELVGPNSGVDQALDHMFDQASKIAAAFKGHSANRHDKGRERQPAVVLPKGLVIYGPGCGCGGLARAIAKEINAHFIAGTTCDPSGRARGPESITHYFKQAKELAKVSPGRQAVMLYLGGVNLLSDQAAESAHQAQATETAIAQEIEELAANSNVLVVVEAQKLSQISSALLADGRFDVQVEVEKPDYKGRLAIFRHHLESDHNPTQSQAAAAAASKQILVTLDGTSEEERAEELNQICQECAVLADGLHADQIYRALFQLRATVATTGNVTPERLYQAIENQQGNL